ncbi:MAG: hypothetical protein NTZ05_16370 [Chloroflexi bacterium]|nr:hypothetical protein [Chloroflexota bacterium]
MPTAASAYTGACRQCGAVGRGRVLLATSIPMSPPCSFVVVGSPGIVPTGYILRQLLDDP